MQIDDGTLMGFAFYIYNVIKVHRILYLYVYVCVCVCILYSVSVVLRSFRNN